MALLAGRVPPELSYVYLAIAPMGLGMGGGAWDPWAVRNWPEQVADDVELVMTTLMKDRVAKGKR